mgnify:CR=1 FL=1
MNRTLLEIAHQLEQAIAACATIGIDIHRGRIATYVKTLRDAADEHATPPARDLIWAAVCEASDIESLALLPQQVLQGCIERLRTLHTGAAMYVDADQNDQGRDTAFELRTALAFHQGGATVSMGVPSDVVACFGEHRVLIECKRIKTLAALRRRILEAYKQFSNHRHRGETAPGIVALDVTLLVNPDFGILVAQNDAEAQNLLHAHVELAMAQASDELQRAARNIRVDAGIDAFMIRVLCMTGRPDGTGQSTACVWRIQPLVHVRSERFAALYNFLQNLPGFEHGIYTFG